MFSLAVRAPHHSGCNSPLLIGLLGSKTQRHTVKSRDLRLRRRLNHQACTALFSVVARSEAERLPGDVKL